MATKSFILPDLGEGLTEAAIVDWLVAEGDSVTVDQPVIEVESAKSVVSLPVPFAGRVTRLGGAVGDTIHKGDVVCEIEVEGAETSEPERGTPPTDAAAPADASESAESGDEGGSGAVLIGYGTSEPKRKRKGGRGSRFGRRASPEAQAPSTAAPTPAAEAAPVSETPAQVIDETRRSPVVSPLVRRMAREGGFNAMHLLGTGPNGLVMRSDVEALLAERAQPAPAVAPSVSSCSTPSAATDGAAPSRGVGTLQEKRIPLNGLRKAVSDHLTHSRRTIPEATIWLDVDATELIRAKRQLEASTGEKFGVTALIAWFALAALRETPVLNASVDEEAGEIVQHGFVNLGVAAQTPRGLTVPIVHGADSMTLRELRDAIGDIATASREGGFPPEKLRGGTFTVNNYGGFGVDGSSPIINHPEAAMLGIGRLKERPWVVDGALCVRNVMTLSFVFDHRVCDGEEASRFIKRVANAIEAPATMFALF